MFLNFAQFFLNALIFDLRVPNLNSSSCRTNVHPFPSHTFLPIFHSPCALKRQTSPHFEYTSVIRRGASHTKRASKFSSSQCSPQVSRKNRPSPQLVGSVFFASGSTSSAGEFDGSVPPSSRRVTSVFPACGLVVNKRHWYTQKSKEP